MRAIRTILIPLLLPSIFASAMIVFATSLDDFVVSQFLFGDASNVTVPIKLYNAVRQPRPRPSTPWPRCFWWRRSWRCSSRTSACGRRGGAARGRPSRTSPTTADRRRRTDQAVAGERGRRLVGRGASTRSDSDGRWTVTGCPVVRLSRVPSCS